MCLLFEWRKRVSGVRNGSSRYRVGSSLGAGNKVDLGGSACVVLRLVCSPWFCSLLGLLCKWLFLFLRGAQVPIPNIYQV